MVMEKQTSVFFPQNSDPSEQKIYLLGNSRMERLDADFINNSLKNDHNYKVHLLAWGGATPVDYLLFLDKIISTKPILVLIGVDPTDIRDGRICNIGDIIFVKNQDAVTNNPEYIKCVMPDKFLGLDFQNFDPQTTTLSLIKTLFMHDQPDEVRFDPKGILTHQQLVSAVKMSPYKRTIIVDNNPNINALEEIIAKLKANGIKVLVVVTPRPQLYLDTIPDTEKQAFSSSLYEIQNKTGVKIYSLLDKYADLEIWSDSNHVTRDQKGLIYSQDVAKIIKNEIEP